MNRGPNALHISTRIYIGNRVECITTSAMPKRIQFSIFQLIMASTLCSSANVTKGEKKRCCERDRKQTQLCIFRRGNSTELCEGGLCAALGFLSFIRTNIDVDAPKQRTLTSFSYLILAVHAARAGIHTNIPWVWVCEYIVQCTAAVAAAAAGKIQWKRLCNSIHCLSLYVHHCLCSLRCARRTLFRHTV